MFLREQVSRLLCSIVWEPESAKHRFSETLRSKIQRHCQRVRLGSCLYLSLEKKKRFPDVAGFGPPQNPVSCEQFGVGLPTKRLSGPHGNWPRADYFQDDCSRWAQHVKLLVPLSTDCTKYVASLFLLGYQRGQTDPARTMALRMLVNQRLHFGVRAVVAHAVMRGGQPAATTKAVPQRTRGIVICCCSWGSPWPTAHSDLSLVIGQ